MTLEKEIPFKVAKTKEDAIEFAQKNFKVKNYIIDDLEVANWVNEALCNINNRFAGKVYMPANIVIQDTTKFKGQAGCYWELYDTLVINSGYINKSAEALVTSKRYNMMNYLLDHPLCTNHENFASVLYQYRANPKSLSKIEKMSLAYSINNRMSVINDNKDNEILKKALKTNNKIQKDYFGPVNYNKFGIIYHEMGHVFMDKATSIRTNRVDDINKFNKLKQNFPVRNYAKSNHKEFCADMFAGLMNGDIYPQVYMDLYQDLTNIKFPDAKINNQGAI